MVDLLIGVWAAASTVLSMFADNSSPLLQEMEEEKKFYSEHHSI